MTEGWWFWTRDPGLYCDAVGVLYPLCDPSYIVRFSSYIRNSRLLAPSNQMSFDFCNSQVIKRLLCLFSVPYLHSPAQKVCWYHLLPVKSSPVEFSLVLSQFLFFMHLQGLLLTSPWLESLCNATHLFKNDYLQVWLWVEKLLKLSNRNMEVICIYFYTCLTFPITENLKLKTMSPRWLCVALIQNEPQKKGPKSWAT